MFQVQADSRFDNPAKQSRLYFLMGVGVLAAVLGYFYFQSPWIAVSTLICFAAVYVVLALPSNRLTLVIEDEGLKVSEEIILDYTNCIGWGILDLGNCFELVIQTNEVRQPFNYFYINKENKEFQNFLIGLTQVIPYQEDISLRDRKHVLLRQLGLK